MEEKLRDIRKRLRLAMNGAISASMRQKGMNYKLIFGVPIMEIRQIAEEYDKDAILARALWKEDVREMKILATLLYPAGSLSLQEALQWAKEIPYPEIAEQCCNNLFPEMKQPCKLAMQLSSCEASPLARMTGILLFSQLFKKGKDVGLEDRRAFLSLCENVLHADDKQKNHWHERQAVVQALKFFGRQSAEQAEEALRIANGPSKAGAGEMKELYDELSFEFEYYNEHNGH